MSEPTSFTIPGFDFLQGLVKNAGAALPGIGSWVAPTIDPAEIEKRIEELRTVQFWLEQNVRMIGATIQALEVQRMTLSTLKTMNVQMEDLRDSLKIRVPSPPPPAPAAAAPPALAPKPAPKPPAPPSEATAAEPATASASGAAPAANPGAVDPLQWWGALTKQFTELATTAMKDTASDASRKLAAAMVKQNLDGKAGATSAAGAVAKTGAVRKTAAGKTGAATASRKRSAKKAAPKTAAARA